MEPIKFCKPGKNTARRMVATAIMPIPLILLFLALTTPALAGHLRSEKWYRNQWCTEHQCVDDEMLPDGTQADCTTPDHIIAFNFDNRWAESLGQALHYSQQSGKKAGIVLIMEGWAAKDNLAMLKATIAGFSLPVDVWTVQE